MVLVFGDHRLDLKRRELRRGGEPVAIEPKAFDLLAFLVRRRDRVVTKDDLLQGVWGGRIVSDSALTTRINAVRRALGDDGTAQRLIRTVTGKGVRFVGEVSELPDEVPFAADKPSIAVLPFANLSGDPEQEYFADGMVEEIITALSRIRWLFVIARNSSFSYKGQSPDVKQVGRELGVRYVLEGSVRKASGRMRITAQLIDGATGAHLWADRFDGSLEDVFDLQDRVATSVAGVIEPALQAAEAARWARRATYDLTAYDLYLRALAVFYPVTREGVTEALELLDRAIASDRSCGPALAWAGICHLRLADDGWSGDYEMSRRAAVAAARQALQIARNDPGILVNAAFVLGRFGEDIDAISALVDRALALNPSFARGWFVSGLLRSWKGRFDQAIEHLETSLRLSPREPTGTPLQVIGGAYFFQRWFGEAASRLLLAIQDNPGVTPTYRLLAACYAHMGRLDEARATIAGLCTITTFIVPSERMLPWRNRQDSELFLSGLRLAASEKA
jgi:TolB-like protein